MFLFDDIKESDISDAVLDSIKGFDSQVQSLSDLLSFGLNDQKYSAFYQVTDLISTGISGICIAIAVVMAYFAIVKEGISLRGDWKKVVTILLRLSISKGLIDASTQFITWIYSFPAAITQKVIEVTTNKGSGLLEQIFNPQDILNGLGITKDSGDISKFVALQYANTILLEHINTSYSLTNIQKDFWLSIDCYKIDSQFILNKLLEMKKDNSLEKNFSDYIIARLDDVIEKLNEDDMYQCEIRLLLYNSDLNDLFDEDFAVTKELNENFYTSYIPQEKISTRKIFERSIYPNTNMDIIHSINVEQLSKMIGADCNV